MRLEPVGPAPWLQRTSLRSARPVGVYCPVGGARGRLPASQPAAWPNLGGTPPSRSSPRGAGQVGAEARCGQSSTWAECAGPQRGAWGRLGRGSLSVVPIRRPAQPSPARAAPATDRLALFMDTRGAAGPARPGHAHTGVGDSPCHNHDTRRPRSDRAGWGRGMAQPGSWFWLKKKGSWGRCGNAGVGGFWGCPGALREPLSGVEGSRCFPTRLKTHRTCYIRADTGWDGMGWGGGNIGGARLPAVAAAPALSTPQGWSRAGETDRL